MLYRAIIGVVPIDHPELQAFIKGFRLPCRNSAKCVASAFRNVKAQMAFQAVRSVAGGSEAFLTTTWTSYISSFDAFEGHIQFLQACNTTVNFGLHLTNFLKGSGIPCPHLFDEARPYFSPLIDLSKVEDIGFRPRVFCWAATGSPSLTLKSEKFRCISLCCFYYRALADPKRWQITFTDERHVLSADKIVFRTCLRQVFIPMKPILEFLHAPGNIEEAINNYFLLEILLAIGNYTVM